MVLCYYPQQPFHHTYSTEIKTPPHSPLFAFDDKEPVWTCSPYTPSTLSTAAMHDMPNPLLASSLDQSAGDQHDSQCPSRKSRSISFDTGRLLQLQTQAAVPRPTRPQTQPVQQSGLDSRTDHYRRASTDTPSPYASSSSSSSSQHAAPSMGPQSPSSATDSSRCSRCKRSPSIDSESETNATAMVQYGLNLFYCSRCAQMVGLKPR